MLFIALAVPVVVVAAAAMVYSERGRGEMRQTAFQTARQFALQATARDDPELRLKDWFQALVWLDKADSYGGSQEATQLRSQVQAGVDGINGVTRLDYRPALSASLGESVKIGRMVPFGDDLYMLDTNQGRILRVHRSGKTTYELDATFSCSPGKYDDIQVDNLVDITILPLDNIINASVMGMDAHGKLLYCGPTIPARAAALLAPDMSWGKPSRLVLNQDKLFVLDTQTNAVYRFQGDKGEFTKKPRLYFDDQVPHLSDVVDLGKDQEYLYLLHGDGSMTACNDTGYVTLCDDPAVFGDGRVGRDPAPLKFPTATFSLIQVALPPDSSLYLLDTKANSIYHFSLRKLNLQGLYRPPVVPDFPPADRHPSAFAVAANHRVFLAVDNQLYFATLP